MEVTARSKLKFCTILSVHKIFSSKFKGNKLSQDTQISKIHEWNFVEIANCRIRSENTADTEIIR